MINFGKSPGDKITRDLTLSEEYENQNQEVKAFTLQDDDQELLERIEEEIEVSVNREGIESLYGKNDHYIRLQALLGVPMLGRLDQRLNGNESFIGATIEIFKKGIKGIIELIKSFFRWIISLFVTKGKSLVNEIKDLQSKCKKESNITKELIVPGKRVLKICFSGQNPELFKHYTFILSNLERTQTLVRQMTELFNYYENRVNMFINGGGGHINIDLDNNEIYRIFNVDIRKSGIVYLPGYRTITMPGIKQHNSVTWFQGDSSYLEDTPLYATNSRTNLEILSSCSNIITDIENYIVNFKKFKTTMEKTFSSVGSDIQTHEIMNYVISVISYIDKVSREIQNSAYDVIDTACYLVRKSLV